MTFDDLWCSLVIPAEFDAMDICDQQRWRGVLQQAFEAGKKAGDERCSAWADIAGAHGAQVDRLKALLREVSASRWECATEDGACPDCGAEDNEEHDSGCLLGQVDAETSA